MERTPTSLKELAQLVLDVQGASIRQVAQRAEKQGHRLTHTTLAQMRAGTYKSVPKEETLRTLAELANIPVEVAFHAAGLTAPGPPLADELPPGSDNLSPKSRAAVIQMLRVLIDLESNDDHHTAHPTPARERAQHDDGEDAAPAGRRGAGRRDAGPRQKTSALGQAPARSLNPADYDLAAHPPMELTRDRQDREWGDVGEENQDHDGEGA